MLLSERNATSTVEGGFLHIIIPDGSAASGFSSYKILAEEISSQWIDIANGISYPDNGVLIGTSIGSDLFYKLQVEGGNVAFRNPSGIDRFTFFGHLNDTQDAVLAMYNGSDAQKARINTNGYSYFLGGNVGIDTSTPLAKFVVSNNGDESLEFGWSSGLSSNYIQSINRGATPGSEDLALYIGGDANLLFYTNNIERLKIANTGLATFSNTVTATDFIIS